jgi:uncharacterized protein (DUF1684 family)
VEVDVDALLAARRSKDRYFAEHVGSPLEPGDRPGFEGLDYYPPDQALVFRARLEPGDREEVRVATSDDRVKVYRRAGRVSFEVEGHPLGLTVYDAGGPGLFIPFRDATSGSETYGGGRYLDVDLESDGSVAVDFNQAYNPYCAYSDGYSCPIPPPENALAVPIRAGERAFVRNPGAGPDVEVPGGSGG